MKQPERFIELDVWRGMAIIGMVVFHAVFLVDFLGYASWSFDRGLWHILARAVQWSFLLLVGIGIQLSFQKSQQDNKKKSQYILHQLKKGMVVFFCSILVTLFSAIWVPFAFVRFGILHLISWSIILLSFLADRPKVSLVIGLAILMLSYPISAQPVSQEWLLIFGFQYPFQSLDYFPVFPWMGVPAIGIYLGSVTYSSFRRNFSIPWTNKQFFGVNFLATMGRRSLLIYLLHIPILIFLIQVVVVAMSLSLFISKYGF